MRSREFSVGAGDTVLFLHSSNTAGWMWGEQFPAFTEHHLLVPDLPGFGENNDREWRSSADTADRLATLIAERAPDRVHVVGLSLGASVALELAARHPDRVVSLFLASAVLVPPSLTARVSSRMMLALWNQPSYWRGTGRSYGLVGDDLDLFVATGAGIKRSTALRIYQEFLPGTDRREARWDHRPHTLRRGRERRCLRPSEVDALLAVGNADRSVRDRPGHAPSLECRGRIAFQPRRARLDPRTQTRGRAASTAGGFIVPRKQRHRRPSITPNRGLRAPHRASRSTRGLPGGRQLWPPVAVVMTGPAEHQSNLDCERVECQSVGRSARRPACALGRDVDHR